MIFHADRICQTYFCQSLDKGTLGFSSIMGIQDDANLKKNDYSWLGTILYMGVLVGEYPTNLLLQKLPVAKYLAAKCVTTPAPQAITDLSPAFSFGEPWLRALPLQLIGVH